MVAKNQKSDYEEARLAKIEENNKRMAELGINTLVLNFKNSSKPSSSVQPKRKMVQKTLDLVQRKKSSRNEGKPKPDYRDVVGYETERAPRRASSSRIRSPTGHFLCASPEERQIALEKAYAFESSLGNKFPSFVKEMKHSHVNKGFWLGLPSDFCEMYLPNMNAKITLVDTEGNEFQTNYIAPRTGLSGGWAGFAQYHKIIDGDACVFQKTKPTEFKVFIIKAEGVSYGEE
ncbi:hypothetical protein MKW92_030153 [Papaver armeniacum]|nr:hypothetical protein MKW92_030153 [Papaver armeniacum]